MAYLEVLPAAAAWQVFHNEAVLCTDWRAILVPSSAAPAAAAAAVTTTFRDDSTHKHALERTKSDTVKKTTGLDYRMKTGQIKLGNIFK